MELLTRKHREILSGFFLNERGQEHGDCCMRCGEAFRNMEGCLGKRDGQCSYGQLAADSEGRLIKETRIRFPSLSEATNRKSIHQYTSLNWERAPRKSTATLPKRCACIQQHQLQSAFKTQQTETGGVDTVLAEHPKKYSKHIRMPFQVI